MRGSGLSLATFLLRYLGLRNARGDGSAASIKKKKSWKKKEGVESSMDYANVVFGAPLWRGPDITLTFACLANSECGCSSGGREPALGDKHVAARVVWRGWRD